MARHFENTVEINGKRIGYSLFVSKGIFQVRFKINKIIKRSTNEKDLMDAHNAARAIISQELNPQATQQELGWNEAIDAIVETMTNLNLKPSSIKEVITAIGQIKHLANTPSQITVNKAKEWYKEYQTTPFQKTENGTSYQRSITTQRSILKKLKSIWNKYIIKHLKITTTNPFAEIELPKKPKLEIRNLTKKDIDNFFEWIDKKYNWWLPTVFFKIKMLSGCRLYDLCSAESNHLTGNVLKLVHTKTNETREISLPKELTDILHKYKGEKYIFENYIGTTPTFEPMNLKYWILRLCSVYNKETGNHIQSHDFRKYFVSKAYAAGWDVIRIATTIGMTPKNLMDNYLALDKSAIQLKGTKELQRILLR